MDPAETLKVVGAIVGAATGIAALGWRVVDEVGSFLRVAVSVEVPSEGWATALTTIENKGYRAKTVSKAFLLIGPEEEDPMETARILLEPGKRPLNFTNDIAVLVPQSSVYKEQRAVIPLSFYTSENVNIGDETLNYRVPIDLKTFRKQTPYSVRFFLFAVGRPHRSTQDLLIIEPSVDTSE